MWALASAAVLAVVMGLAAGPVVRRLKEPEDVGDDPKLPYAALASASFAILTGCLSLGSASIAFLLTPPAAWLPWAALAGPGALAIAIDARTTWMPRVVLYAVGAGTAAGIVVWSLATADPAVALRSLCGAVAVGGFFALFWRLTGGIGFSDVRLMACVGAITAAASIDLAIAATLAGTILGACWGLLRRVLGRSGHFAYGPALWAGPFLALLLAQLPSTQL